MQHFIRHIAAWLTGIILLSGGCRGVDLLERNGDEIRFQASPVQLTDFATKAGEHDELLTDFPDGENIVTVWGWHKEEQILSSVGLTKSGSAWSYAPLKKWNWVSDSDYYDFLGAKTGQGVSYTNTPTQALTANYNSVSDKHDLLMAAYRRTATTTPSRNATVNLEFQHMLSAVKVKFFKGASSQDFKLVSFKFNNIAVSSTARAELSDSGVPFFSWQGSSYTTSPVLGESFSPAKESSNTSDFPVISSVPTFDPGFFDLVIPQNLLVTAQEQFERGDPVLIVTFTNADGSITYSDPPIKLSDIPDKTTHEKITEWKRGWKYTYEITIRLGGDVEVNVITTRWDDVKAETPGISLYE